MRPAAMAKRHFQTGNDWNRLQLFWEEAALQRLRSSTVSCQVHAVWHKADASAVGRLLMQWRLEDATLKFEDDDLAPVAL